MYLIFGLGLAAFVFSLILTPLIRDGLGRLVVDRPDGGRKRHERPVPRVGGVSIALAYVGAFALMMALPVSYGSAASLAMPTIWKLFGAAGLVFATGLFDDLMGYFPWQKLAGQVAAAGLAYYIGVRIEILPGQAGQLWWNIPLSVLWLVGCTNAFNLIDGLDGLAAGVGLFATITMLLAAFANHNLQLALVTMPLAGALIGFLRYNFNPASVFLGDSGSQLIGFLLGCYGVLWSQKSATLLGMTAPVMALAIPLLDTGLSIARRFLRHKPIFAADHGHIHHMLLARGMTARKAALVLYAICGAGAALSLTMNALHNQFAGLVVVLFCVSAWIGIRQLGYTEFAAARQLFARGRFRRIIDHHARLSQFEKSLQDSATREECWRVLQAGGTEFGFESVRLTVNGRVDEAALTAGLKAGTARACWEMRIPLGDGESVEFGREMGDDPLGSLMVGGFADVVGRVLPGKMAEFGVGGTRTTGSSPSRPAGYR